MLPTEAARGVRSKSYLRTRPRVCSDGKVISCWNKNGIPLSDGREIEMGWYQLSLQAFFRAPTDPQRLLQSKVQEQAF